MDSVKREDNLADEKEHWFKIYMALDQDKEIEEQVKNVKKHLAQERSIHLRSMHENTLSGLDALKLTNAVHRRLAVRQYALLLKLEKLEDPSQRKALAKGDYLQEKRMLLDEISRVEQLRLGEEFLGSIIGSVRSLQYAIHETALEVEHMKLLMK